MTSKVFEASNNEDVKIVNSSKANKIKKTLFIFLKFKNTKFKIEKYFKSIEKLKFLTSNAKKTFNICIY